MARLVKLTGEDDYTRSDTLWWVGKTHKVRMNFREPKLCTSGVIHAYRSTAHAIIMNPIHCNLGRFHLWAAVGDVVVDDGNKVGVYELTTTKLKHPSYRMPHWSRDLPLEVVRKRIAQDVIRKACNLLLINPKSKLSSDARKEVLAARDVYMSSVAFESRCTIVHWSDNVALSDSRFNKCPGVYHLGSALCCAARVFTSMTREDIGVYCARAVMHLSMYYTDYSNAATGSKVIGRILKHSVNSVVLELKNTQGQYNK